MSPLELSITVPTAPHVTQVSASGSQDVVSDAEIPTLVLDTSTLSYRDTADEKHVRFDLPSPSTVKECYAHDAVVKKQVRFDLGSTEKRYAPRFPPTWNLYLIHGSFHRAYMIGSHMEAPIYALSVHKGWKKDFITLHNGIRRSHPLLASLEYNVLLKCRNALIAPPAIVVRHSSDVLAEVLRATEGPNVSYEFKTPIPQIQHRPGIEQHKESFEWRFSRDDVVKSLKGMGFGFVLVRVSSQDYQYGGRCWTPPDKYESREEIVAVLAGSAQPQLWPRGGFRFRTPRSKLLKFQFLGSRTTGELGETWEFMAVMSALWIFKRMGRLRRRDLKQEMEQRMGRRKEEMLKEEMIKEEKIKEEMIKEETEKEEPEKEETEKRKWEKRMSKLGYTV